MDHEIYVKLAERLNQCEFTMPPVDAFYEMLEMLYTEEEARIATKFPMGPLTAEDLSSLYSETGDLVNVLETMVEKGHFFAFTSEDGKRKYELSPWYPGVLEITILRLLKEPEGIQKYMDLEEKIRQQGGELMQGLLDGGMDLETFKSMLPKPQLRTLVLNENLPSTTTVHSYEDVLQLIDNEVTFAAQPCCCREMAYLRNEPCTIKNEISQYTCLSFGVTADYILELGHGIRLTKEECLDTIDKLALAGAVFNANNFVEGVQFICACCKCCCGTLQMARASDNMNNIETSNFVSTVDRETCIGCEQCIDHCPMEAITLFDDIAFVDASICIGCAGCIPVCPEGSLSMERRSNKKPELGDRVLGFGASQFRNKQN